MAYCLQSLKLDGKGEEEHIKSALLSNSAQRRMSNNQKKEPIMQTIPQFKQETKKASKGAFSTFSAKSPGFFLLADMSLEFQGLCLQAFFLKMQLPTLEERTIVL